jgi:P-type E1-E2 ATPase
MLGGINRAARHQIIVRHGAALEQLAIVDIALFDKTGTVTRGRPAVVSITPVPPFEEPELVAWAGAVEQGSSHLLARTFVEAAEARVGRLPEATNVVEAAGRGVTGMVAGHRVTIGALTLLREWEPSAAADLPTDHVAAGLRAYIAVDGKPAGVVDYADQVRSEATSVMKALTRLGIRRQVLLSGDRALNVLAVARQIGCTDAAGDLLPQDKVDYVARLANAGHTVLMVGDGANDAPALSAAAVGIALSAHGGGISTEAADVVLLVDDLRRLPEVLAIARRTMRIARQSIGVGLGLSAVAMVAAALGYITPIGGALLQEAIDVAVILNALRAVGPGPEEKLLHGQLNPTIASPSLQAAEPGIPVRPL